MEFTPADPVLAAAEAAVSAVSADAVRAGELYASGKSVAEVAEAMGIKYVKARTLIKKSGTPIRDASARLKGRKHKPKAAEAAAETASETVAEAAPTITHADPPAAPPVAPAFNPGGTGISLSL